MIEPFITYNIYTKTDLPLFAYDYVTKR